MYPASSDVEVGDVLSQGTKQVNTYNFKSDSSVDWNSVKGTVSQVVKATKPYDQQIFGVVSDNYLDFVSTGYNIKQSDHPKSVALVGRVLVKASTENGDIAPGDFLTASATQSGYAMKATQPGYVIGQALAPYSGSGNGTVMIFVRVQYFPGQQNMMMSTDNVNVAGTATINDLAVTGNATVNDLVVTSAATVKTLTVTQTALIGDLTVSHSINTQTVKVIGTAEVGNIIIDEGVKLGKPSEDPTANNSHPISKRFKASKAISAGEGVIADARDGWATTTNVAGDTRVIGIAITSGARGATIDVAIGGTARVKAIGSTTNGQLLHTATAEGRASVVSHANVGEVIGKVLSSPNSNGQILVLITLQ